MNKELYNLIQNTRSTLQYLDLSTNKKINSIIKLIEINILEKNLNYKLSEMAVKETGFGNINDKMYKNFYKTKNLLKDISKIKVNEPFYNKKKKIYEIIKPIGLICGVTPSTNPVATALNYIINSIKCRNAIIICPNPRSYEVTNLLVYKIKKIFRENSIPDEIVNIVPKSVLRSEELISIFDSCDKNIVTGNKNFINKVRKSSRPFLTFGVGNVPVIINHDANLSYAIKSIIKSKTFDNSTSCSADSVLIVHEKIYKKFLKKLLLNKCYVLKNNDKEKLNKIYFTKGFVNPNIIGKDAKSILKFIEVKENNKKLIIYEKNKFDKNHFIFNEKIMPIIGLISFKSIDDAKKISKNILEINGLGHSAGIYSNNKKFILEISKELNVSRIIVNQPHSQSAGGSLNNSLDTTLSLGCGTWGNSLINNNLNFLDFANKTTVSFKIK